MLQILVTSKSIVFNTENAVRNNDRSFSDLRIHHQIFSVFAINNTILHAVIRIFRCDGNRGQVLARSNRAAHFLYAGRDFQAGQSITSSKSAFAKLLHAVGNRHIGQFVAIRKSRIANAQYAARNHDTGHAFASVKSPIANACYTIWDRYAFQIGAIGKSIPANARNTVRDHGFFDFLIPPQLIAETRHIAGTADGQCPLTVQHPGQVAAVALRTAGAAAHNFQRFRSFLAAAGAGISHSAVLFRSCGLNHVANAPRMAESGKLVGICLSAAVLRALARSMARFGASGPFFHIPLCKIVNGCHLQNCFAVLTDTDRMECFFTV